MNDLCFSCKRRYAAESINIACKWGYNGVKSGQTLSGKLINYYFFWHAIDGCLISLSIYIYCRELLSFKAAFGDETNSSGRSSVSHDIE